MPRADYYLCSTSSPFLPHFKKSWCICPQHKQDSSMGRRVGGCAGISNARGVAARRSGAPGLRWRAHSGQAARGPRGLPRARPGHAGLGPRRRGQVLLDALQGLHPHPHPHPQPRPHPRPNPKPNPRRRPRPRPNPNPNPNPSPNPNPARRARRCSRDSSGWPPAGRSWTFAR